MSTITVSSASGLSAALKIAQSGDTIALEAGTYSGVSITNLKFPGGITITSADANNQATLTDLKVTGSENITFRGLEFTTEFAKADNPFQVYGSKGIHFDSLDVHGSLDGNAGNDVAAFLLRASTDISVTNSEFHELLFGIGSLDNNGVNFSGNQFHDIRSDGIRGAGTSNAVISNNTFKDFRPETGDHPDAIQFWTANTSASAQNIVISGNVIMRGDGGSIQGIFLGDESGGKLPYLNVTIKDNLLVGTGWNGIALAGKTSVISDNILVSFADEVTRIRVQNSDGVLVKDNQAGGYVYITSTNVTESGNGTTRVVTDGGVDALKAWYALHSSGAVELPSGVAQSESVTTVTPEPTVPSEPAPVPVPVPAPAPTLTSGAGLTLQATATGGVLLGGAGNDTIVGAAGIDKLNGGAGDDLLKGGDGNDILYGMDGNDRLEGGAGDDVLYGGAGTNTLLGGAGNDSYQVSSATDIVVENVGEGYDTVYASVDFTLPTNIEALRLQGLTVTGIGNAGDNLLVGNAANNILKGLDGNDRLEGGAGNDTLDGGSGNDALLGGDGDDSLIGGAGNDTLGGDAGNDYLSGGAGNDLIYSGSGNDTMSGGAGADSFIFKAGDLVGGPQASMDVILDFSRAEGDKIHLVELDANLLTPVNDAFKFIGASAFHKIAGELRYEVVNGSAFVYGDMNGDGQADLKIQLVGVTNLQASDFAL